MADKLTVTFTDANGATATTRFWIDAAANAGGAVQALANLSNAAITQAYISSPVDISALTGNTATASNVETARAKAKIKMRGPDLGSAAAPFAFVTISIPAPIGTLINGLSGDLTNADALALMGWTKSSSDVDMDTLFKIYYARSR